jgi:hypothetical protein
MFDDSTYKQTTIRFNNEDGETVVLKNVPAFYHDAGVLLYDVGHSYIVCGYQIDKRQRDDYDYWFKLNMTCGAGIQLRKRRYHSKQNLFNEEYEYGEPERDDYFFLGGLDTPKAKAPSLYVTSAGRTVVDVDYYAATQDDPEYPEIVIEGKHLTGCELEEVLPEQVAGWSDDDLEHLLRMFPGQEFESPEAFADALESIRVTRDGGTELLTLDTSVFQMQDWINDHCIQKPEWAYKWIDCYEHSGCAYSESGTGMQCRFDTSPDVGVWYLSEQLIKDITAEMQRKIEEAKKALKPGEELDIAKFEEERDAEIQKNFLHDMAMLGNTDTALCIVHAAYYKKDLQDDPDIEAEEEIYECAIFEGITFPYGDGDKYLLKTEGNTHIPYEILEEETQDPWS